MIFDGNDDNACVSFPPPPLLDNDDDDDDDGGGDDDVAVEKSGILAKKEYAAFLYLLRCRLAFPSP